MNDNQKLSPKYWVIHDITTDDVIIETLDKSLCACSTKATEFFHGHTVWLDNPNYKAILISIEEVTNE